MRLVRLFLIFRPFIQIVLCCACRGAFASKHRGVIAVELGFDPAIIAHTDQFGVVGIGKHGVLALQFLDDALDGGFYTEGFAALDAVIGFFFVNDAISQGGWA